MSIEVVNGKIIITEKKNGEEIKKEYRDIFSAIRAHIYAIAKTLEKEFNPFLIQSLIQRASFLISLKKNEVKELEKSLIELKAIREEIDERKKLSVINKNIANLRNKKVIPGLRKIAQKYIPYFNNIQHKEKIQENLEKFIEELEKERENIQKNEKELKSIEKKKGSKKSKDILSIEADKFVAKVHNVLGEELYLVICLEKEDLKIVCSFIPEEKLYDYRKLIPKEEDVEILKKTLLKLKNTKS